MVRTNDLKKGTRIKLANGWFATIEDNKKGNIRLATVEGLDTEMGSVYAHDIVQARVQTDFKANGGYEWQAVEHTAGQVQARRFNGALFGDDASVSLRAKSSRAFEEE